MKILACLTLGTALLFISGPTNSSQAADLAPDQFDLKSFMDPSKSSEYVEVNLGRHLIRMAAQLVEPSEAEAAEILRGLEQVRVHVLRLTDDNREPVLGHIESIRTHLDSKHWERVVTVNQDGENVCVQLKARDEEVVEGILVTVINGEREAVVVQITGNIRPAQIGEVAERLNIGPLKRIRRQLEEHHS